VGPTAALIAPRAAEVREQRPRRCNRRGFGPVKTTLRSVCRFSKIMPLRTEAMVTDRARRRQRGRHPEQARHYGSLWISPGSHSTENLVHVLPIRHAGQRRFGSCGKNWCAARSARSPGGLPASQDVSPRSTYSRIAICRSHRGQRIDGTPRSSRAEVRISADAARGMSGDQHRRQGSQVWRPDALMRGQRYARQLDAQRVVRSGLDGLRIRRP